MVLSRKRLLYTPCHKGIIFKHMQGSTRVHGHELLHVPGARQAQQSKEVKALAGLGSGIVAGKLKVGSLYRYIYSHILP